jgi:hypothetical protein
VRHEAGDVVLSGVTVRNEQVQVLARLLEGEELAAKLTRAMKNKNDLVALSAADRQLIVTVLDPIPSGLADLRDVLVKQLKQARERESREERSREAQRMRDAWQRDKR